MATFDAVVSDLAETFLNSLNRKDRTAFIVRLESSFVVVEDSSVLAGEILIPMANLRFFSPFLISRVLLGLLVEDFG